MFEPRPYQKIDADSLRYLPDGRLAYRASISKSDNSGNSDKDDAYVLVVDGKEVQRLWEGPFSPDGHRFAYVQRSNSSFSHYATKLVIDGVDAVFSTGELLLANSDDGKHVAHVSRPEESGSFSIGVDGHEIGTVECSEVLSIKFKAEDRIELFARNSYNRVDVVECAFSPGDFKPERVTRAGGPKPSVSAKVQERVDNLQHGANFVLYIEWPDQNDVDRRHRFKFAVQPTTREETGKITQKQAFKIIDLLTTLDFLETAETGIGSNVGRNVVVGVWADKKRYYQNWGLGTETVKRLELLGGALDGSQEMWKCINEVRKDVEALPAREPLARRIKQVNLDDLMTKLTPVVGPGLRKERLLIDSCPMESLVLKRSGGEQTLLRVIPLPLDVSAWREYRLAGSDLYLGSVLGGNDSITVLYSQAVNEKWDNVIESLKLEPVRLIFETLSRADELRLHPEWFVMKLTPAREHAKQCDSLVFALNKPEADSNGPAGPLPGLGPVLPATGEGAATFVAITPQQVTKLIDYMVRHEYESNNDASNGYEVSVCSNRKAPNEVIGGRVLRRAMYWNLSMIAELKSLRAVMDGEAGKAMDGLLAKAEATTSASPIASGSTSRPGVASAPAYRLWVLQDLYATGKALLPSSQPSDLPTLPDGRYDPAKVVLSPNVIRSIGCTSIETCCT